MFLNKILVLIVLLICRPACYSQDNGIRFLENPEFSLIIDKASKENKPIFIDCSAKWCGVCKLMDKEVFSTREAGDFFNDNMINVRYDIESPEGARFNKSYRIPLVPTCLFLNSEGKLLNYGEGYLDASKLIEAAKLSFKLEGRSFSVKK